MMLKLTEHVDLASLFHDSFQLVEIIQVSMDCIVFDTNGRLRLDTKT